MSQKFETAGSHDFQRLENAPAKISSKMELF